MDASLSALWQKTRNLQQQYLDELGKYSSEQLTFQPGEKEWNLLGVANHLIKSERATIKYIKHKLSQQKTLIPDWNSPFKMIGLKIALWLPIRYKVPAKDLHPDPELSLEQINNEWAATRADMLEVLENFPNELINKKIFKHPIAGPMNIKETLGFWQAHLQHHAQQLARIKAHPKFPKAQRATAAS